MKACKLALAAALAWGLLLLCPGGLLASDEEQEKEKVPQDRIDEIQLSIDWEGGEPAPYLGREIDEAIEKTLKLAILDQMDASIPALTRSIEQVTATLKNVINTVLERKGMELRSIDLVPGRVTKAHLVIRLASEKIESFVVHFRFSSSTPFLDAITAEERLALTDELAAQLKGTPFSDRDWVERLVRRQVEDFFSSREAYTDFNRLVLVVPESTTHVYVTFLPREEATRVGRYFLKLRSETMLNLMLADIGALVGSHLENLRDLPVGFVEDKARTVQDYVVQEVEGMEVLSIMRPMVRAELYVAGTDISFVLWVDSRRWRSDLTGRVDFNREGDNARFDFTAGLRFGRDFDTFFHGILLPGDLEFRPQLGVAAHGGKHGFAEAAYDFKLNSAVYRARLNLLPDFYISAERYAKRKLEHENEYSFTYIYRNAYEFKIISDLKGEVFGAVAVRI